jgi:hypothetical protein
VGRGPIVSPDERALVRALVTVPGRPAPMPAQEFLRRFGATDGKTLGRDLVRDAAARRDSLDLEYAMIVCFKFGFADDLVQSLIELAFANWHEQHENVASALGTLRSPLSVEALIHLAEWVPSYLEFDDARALAVKAIWALDGIGTAEARQALEILSRSDNANIAQNAKARLSGQPD